MTWIPRNLLNETIAQSKLAIFQPVRGNETQRRSNVDLSERLRHRQPGALQERLNSRVWKHSRAVGLSPPYTVARISQWEKNNEDHLQELQDVFRKADQDSNGLISRNELVNALEDIIVSPITSEWLADGKVSNIAQCFNCDERGGMGFKEFVSLIRAGNLLDGKLMEYQKVFQALDVSGNGSLCAPEIKLLMEALHQPVSDTNLWKTFEKYDKDGSGQIDFEEFVNMFADQLVDVKDILHYLELHPRNDAPSPVSLIKADYGGVTMIFSEDELDCLLEANSEKLTVLEASLTWCRPCKGFERTFQKFAELFPETLFLKFYGNSNSNCKHLIENRVKAEQTPTFTFYRNRVSLGQVTGANKGRLFEKLTEFLKPEESPLTIMTAFQQQVWRTKLGLG